MYGRTYDLTKQGLYDDPDALVYMYFTNNPVEKTFDKFTDCLERDDIDNTYEIDEDLQIVINLVEWFESTSKCTAIC